MFELRDDRLERAFGRERAGVQLVDDESFERQPAPTLIRPSVLFGSDHTRRAMHTLRLPARDRIGSLLRTIEHIKIVRARTDAGHDDLEGVVRAARQLVRPRFVANDLEGEPFKAWRPDAKARAAI